MVQNFMPPIEGARKIIDHVHGIGLVIMPRYGPVLITALFLKRPDGLRHPAILFDLGVN
jgi:hypothetical protein